MVKIEMVWGIGLCLKLFVTIKILQKSYDVIILSIVETVNAN